MRDSKLKSEFEKMVNKEMSSWNTKLVNEQELFRKFINDIYQCQSVHLKQHSYSDLCIFSDITDIFIFL